MTDLNPDKAMHACWSRPPVGLTGPVATSAAIAVIVMAWAPTEATACSYGEYYAGTVPEAGCALPSNSGLVLLGFVYGLDGLELTVDGEQVDAEIVTGFGPDRPGEGDPVGSVIAFADGLPEGKTLIVTGDPCTDYDCEEVDLAFPIIAPSERAPPVPVIVGTRWHHWVPSVDCSAEPGNCEDETGTLLVEASVSDEASSHPVPLFWEIEAEAGTGHLARRVLRMTGTRVYGRISIPREAESSDPPCVRMRTQDATGATSAWTAFSCSPCDVVFTDAVSCALPEPAWGGTCTPPADPGPRLGLCAEPEPEPDTSEGGEPTRRGCSIADPSHAALLLLILLGWRRPRDDTSARDELEEGSA